MPFSASLAISIGDTARRAMRSSLGDGVAAATINRSSTTSTDTKPTPTPFLHSRATGVWPDRYPGCAHGSRPSSIRPRLVVTPVKPPLAVPASATH
uniref:Uncharacterized protein n=1 Tax=Oryza sativa subsp. japonica TaxID=39947 RepID=Q8LMW9_ORYSJ|nr:hypothetical protein [Oryza sativa Japonica Group]